uniref:Nonsense-mediated mRNA decay factor n=1 Tax=Salmo trutta TaxID=8032 RepID=A0A674CN33_SALTR
MSFLIPPMTITSNSPAIITVSCVLRAVVESVHKLDVIIGSKSSYREVFKPENISLRNKLRELCVKLMFLHPVDYGRKAEELLWRKVYYEVIQVVKTHKKHIHSRSALECAYRTHLIAGVGFYQHLLLYIQSHYQLEMQDCIDWTHVTDPLIGRKKPVSATPKEMDWAQMACHRCLVYLGDLARYQNELAGVEAEQLSERFYHQALSVTPHVGMPFNQLGTLAGSKFYNVEATYYYLRCIQSETPFEGAYGNLKRLFDKAAKMYHQVKKQEMKKLSPSRSKDIKQLLVSFMYLQSLLQPKNSSLLETELTSLCQSVLEDFNLVLFYLPSPPHVHEATSPSEEELEEHDSPCALCIFLFLQILICRLVCVGSKQYSASIAFTLALFSHLVNHVNIRLQAELEEGESQVPPLQTDNTGVGERKAEEEKQKQKKYARLSMLRRRRATCKEDESDLSEGFESDEEEEEEEEHPTEEGTWESGSEEDEEDDEEQANPREDGDGDTPPATNGPLLPSDPSISSNLQAMSSQLFQAKRCFRLAPTFSNVLLRPHSSATNPTPTPTDPDVDSDSECSVHSNQSVHSEKTLSERLEILTNQGLIQVVKVFVDWLRTNTDIIVMCAQSSQSLWNRLSVLLNLLPDGSKMLEAELGLNTEVMELLSECEQPGLVQSLLLPEDLALRHLPALNLAHRRLDYTRPRPSLSPVQECVARVCCIRSFGHFLTNLQCNVLHFNPEAGIFTSISQSEQDNLVQQAKAQIRMAEEEARRNRLMRDMAQLRLQLEVSQLEGSLQQPKTQSSMSPYLVPDSAALCQHLNLLRHLAGSGCFIIIIPRTVIDGLDHLKKENAGARDGIRFLESEFRKGNRYIRCQKESGRSFERDKLKRQDMEAWHLYKTVDSCRQLTVSQSNGDEDTAGMVTILTGHSVEDLCTRSAPMKSAIQAVATAGMELKNIVEFYRQWKEIG